MRLLIIIFCILSFGLKLTAQEIDHQLKKSIHQLDSYMQNNDSAISQLLSKDVSFGHSNGWTQTYSDFEKRFSQQKARYQKIQNIEFKETKTWKKISSIRRIIHVKGTYKDIPFSMNLSTLEIWKKTKGKWKLWSRQSVEIKP